MGKSTDSRLRQITINPTVYITVTGAVAVIVWLQDYVRSYLNSSSFYFSESFIFSSFWWIFLPVALIIWNKRFTSTKQYHFHLILAMVFHLPAFAGVVWGLSSLFLDHTYDFAGVLQYGLSEHAYQLVLIYSILAFLRYHTQAPENSVNATVNSYSPEILVNDGHRTLRIATAGISKITARPPYILIRNHDQAYLQSGTIRGIIAKLDPKDFCRVHRSIIVNINHVTAFASRGNGDYDLTLTDGSQIRLSRSFAREFKARYETTRLSSN